MSDHKRLDILKERVAANFRHIPLHQVLWLIERSRKETERQIKRAQQEIVLMSHPTWEPLPRFAGDHEYETREVQLEKTQRSLATEIKLLTLLDVLHNFVRHIDDLGFSKDIAEHFGWTKNRPG